MVCQDTLGRALQLKKGFGRDRIPLVLYRTVLAEVYKDN
jgi:hypothetical protein